MRKSLIAAAVLIMVFAVSASANFKEGEMPLAAMAADTAYTLNGGTWQIEEGFPALALPITYGIIDGLQVGTKFLVWIPQCPNVNAKWNFLKDEGSMPAVTIGSEVIAFGNLETMGSKNVILFYFNISAYVSKMIIPKLYLSGSYTYNNASAGRSLAGSQNEVVKLFARFSGSDEPEAFHNAALSIIYQMADNTRLSVDSIFFMGSKASVNISAGFMWALGDAARLKLGMLTYFGGDKPAYLPVGSLSFRF